MGWKERIEAKKAELAAAEAALSKEDSDEIASREAEGELESKIREVRGKRRTLDMQRSVDLWRDKLSAGGKRVYIDGLQIEGREDFFIIVANKEAQEALTARVNHKQTKPTDIPRIYLDYAMRAVKQWNDVDTSSFNADGSMRLRVFLAEEPGVVSTISQAVSRLAGAHAADAKS